MANKKLRDEGVLDSTQVKREKEKKQEVEDKRPIKNEYVTNNITNHITHEDIHKITSEAISKYDIDRKERKKIKIIENQKEEDRKKVVKSLNKALGNRYGEQGFFNGCFD